MNQLPQITSSNLPDTIEDLSRFVLVGREKLNSVRAEIRAIDKIQLATEVRDQKRDEARMLSEALLDAEVRLGDMMKAIPKAQGSRKDIQRSNSTVTKSTQSKEEIINDLGFDKMQVSRFETLADNKDLVEQVKAEARENDDLPTRTQVLSLAKARNDRYERDMQQIDEDHKCLQQFWKAVKPIRSLRDDEDFVDSLIRAIVLEEGYEVESIEHEMELINGAVTILTHIGHCLLKKKGELRGKKK